MALFLSYFMVCNIEFMGFENRKYNLEVKFMEIYKISSIIIALANIYIVYKLNILSEAKAYLFKFFEVNDQGYFGHIALCFYIFGITFIFVYNLFLFNLGNIIQIIFPLFGFPLIYKMIIRINP